MAGQQRERQWVTIRARGRCSFLRAALQRLVADLPATEESVFVAAAVVGDAAAAADDVAVIAVVVAVVVAAVVAVAAVVVAVAAAEQSIQLV